MSGLWSFFGWRQGCAVVAMTAVMLGAARVAGLGSGRSGLFAVIRAGVQLLAVSTVVVLAFRNVAMACGFIVVMLVVAAITSAGRAEVNSARWRVMAVITAGSIPMLAIILATGAAPVEPATIVAFGGILIGGSMTACSLSLRYSLRAVRERQGEVEAAMALGLSKVSAMSMVVDRERLEALVPVLDQTRTVGLVTLPGAFIGVLLAGGAAGAAAVAQLLVLVGLVGAETVVVALSSRFVAKGWILPDDLQRALPPR